MKLHEISELKPLIWTLLDNLVSGTMPTRIDVIAYRRGDAPSKGYIYSTQLVVSSHNNVPCSMADAALLRILYTSDDAGAASTISDWTRRLRSFYLDTDADDNYTIKKIDGVPTLVNV